MYRIKARLKCEGIIQKIFYNQSGDADADYAPSLEVTLSKLSIAILVHQSRFAPFLTANKQLPTKLPVLMQSLMHLAPGKTTTIPG